MVKRILYVFLSFILLGVFSMAIILPSAHIYNTNNPKVRDNNVGNVSVENTVVEPDNNYEVIVGNHKHIGRPEIVVDYGNNDYDTRESGQALTTYKGQYSSAKFYYYEFNITINPELKNECITHIFDWVSKEEENAEENATANGVKYSLFGEKITTPATATFVFTNNTDSGYSRDLQYGVPETDDSATLSLPTITLFGIDGKYIPLNLKDETHITITPPSQENNNMFIISCKILGGIEYEFLKGFTVGSPYLTPDPITISGNKIKYDTQQIEITIYGNTLGISLADGTITYGSGGKPLTLSGNELLQDNATTYGTPTTSYLANRVLSEYVNGKETATVLVSVSEYYDENGELAISTKNNGLPMTFRIGDLVIPQTYGVDGVDRPMSRYKDGSPKIFRVVGREPYFDGAVWQKLSLQEFDKANLS